jgi:ribose transport system substrate-binding protein
VTPPKGKNVWVVTIGQLAVSSQLIAKAFTDEASNLGWKVTVFDGKFEPGKWLEGIRSAIAANADAIVVASGIDCASVTPALKEAKAAGIPTINIQGVDCNAEGGEKLFTYDLTYAPGNSSLEEWATSLGNAQGSWVAAEKPQGKILSVVETDARITVGMGEGFKEVIDKYCPECEVVQEIKFVGTEIGPTLQNKVEQELLRHPEVDVVYGNYDDVVVGSVEPAIRNAGREDEISLIGCEGQKPNIELMYEGKEAAGAGVSNTFEGYAGLDATIRILAGKKPLGNTGEGTQLYDRQNNLPVKGEHYETAVDFKSAYRKAWGVE